MTQTPDKQTPAAADMADDTTPAPSEAKVLDMSPSDLDAYLTKRGLDPASDDGVKLKADIADMRAERARIVEEARAETLAQFAPYVLSPTYHGPVYEPEYIERLKAREPQPKGSQIPMDGRVATDSELAAWLKLSPEEQVGVGHERLEALWRKVSLDGEKADKARAATARTRAAQQAMLDAPYATDAMLAAGRHGRGR